MHDLVAPPDLTFSLNNVYQSRMLLLLQRSLICLLLCFAVGAYAGVFKTAAALAAHQAPEAATGCCAHEQEREKVPQTPCGQEDCSCPCCLTAELPEFTLLLKTGRPAACPFPGLTATLYGDSYRTIDYPPETA